MSIGILYVEDHEVFHDCMRHFFDSQTEMKILAVANNGRTAVKLARDLSPDVIIMDIMIPALNGIEATRQIVQENPKVRVIGLSVVSDGRRVMEMFRAGARGYVSKECAFSELVHAIQVVMAGKMYLSPSVTDLVVDDYLNHTPAESVAGLDLLSAREKEILHLVAEGKTSKDIADELHLAPKTIETHRASIMKKLNLNSIADLIKFAIREGLIDL
ncbi:DNA-binding response regulator [Desulfuromonas versatilis]|uniref:DNA-binding response regulator n=1 Tax=Desulfuromonas versatilis TaxID=2802975 RepID=A0ABN6E2L2_9BACT|nr:response regulator transcription factor [Desulfuromonas versatilis]BCR06427.1 DNA-binding response regulator [Desulfuromonas versatilis]